MTITPETGRVGTIAVVRGAGFPSKNDEGSSFNIEIEYDASNGNSTTVSATPDASGRFEDQLRIPTTAAIPSSNTVKVRFEDDDDIIVPLTVPHEVPEGIIETSVTSGGPGSSVTVSGEGFQVLRAHQPGPDWSAGRDSGSQAFHRWQRHDVLRYHHPRPGCGYPDHRGHVGRTTSSVGFTVTESGQPRRHQGGRTGP